VLIRESWAEEETGCTTINCQMRTCHSDRSVTWQALC